MQNKTLTNFNHEHELFLLTYMMTCIGITLCTMQLIYHCAKRNSYHILKDLENLEEREDNQEDLNNPPKYDDIV